MLLRKGICGKSKKALYINMIYIFCRGFKEAFRDIVVLSYKAIRATQACKGIKTLDSFGGLVCFKVQSLKTLRN